MIKNLALRCIKQNFPIKFKPGQLYTFNSLKHKQLPAFERLRLIEQIERQTNIEVLKRELMNDSVQLPLKFCAYYFAPITNQSTFWAELIRSGIDAINHLILFATSQLNLSPSERYPYGIEKVKNMVVLIPALLFLYFGCEIQYEQFFKIYNGIQISEHSEIPTSPTALILYLMSIAIETGIISKNIKSAMNAESAEDQQKKHKFLDKLRMIFKGKDPVLQAVLFENAITLTSTLVPLLSSLLTLFFPSPIYEIVGSMIIGAIQIKLGYHLMKKNARKLMGEEAIDRHSLKKIENIILKNPFVQGIGKQRAVMTGSRKFRFAAEITFDTKKISREIFEEYYDEMERIVYSDTYSEREAYLKELIHEVPKKLLAKLHLEINKISQAIKEEFPNCTHDDLEINQQSLVDIYTDDEWENNLYQNVVVYDENPIIPFEKWMQEEADKLILFFNLKDQKKENKIFLTTEEYKNSLEYHQMDCPTEVDEDQLLLEDYRFGELQAEFLQNDQ